MLVILKWVIAYASKTLNASQVVNRFKYYLTGWHFGMMTDDVNLTGVHIFKEQKVDDGSLSYSCLILKLYIGPVNIGTMPLGYHTWLPGTANVTLALGVPHSSIRWPLNRNKLTAVTLQDQYLEHFDGYIELIQDGSALFRDPTAHVPSPQILTICFGIWPATPRSVMVSLSLKWAKCRPLLVLYWQLIELNLLSGSWTWIVGGPVPTENLRISPSTDKVLMCQYLWQGSCYWWLQAS